MKIVINTCFGGYSLSPKALLLLWEKGFRDNATTIKNYYGENYLNETSYKDDLFQFENYKLGLDHNKVFLIVFSPDGLYVLSARPNDRSHPMLVECVETLGIEADGVCAELKVVEIPDGVDYQVEEYDGREHIAEKHRTWYA